MSQRGLVINFEGFLGDADELGMLGVGEVIVIKESTVTFLDHLSVGRMEDGVVNGVEGEVDASLGDFGAVGSVGAVKSSDVARDGQWSVDLGVFGVELGLVEIVGVGHVVSVDG